ncbi:DUF977 family protein [Candidatus Parcubacteria bacterium]|nr:MAG: DUF977 family protein [Candidatus Parcubacteria bacterium]
MARLEYGEREKRKNRIYRLIRRHRWGLKESEIAEATGLHRRVVNNYLRELKNQGQIYKDGRYWFAE